MEAQDQPIGPRVFWTIGFLGLGTLSAIGAHALFPWPLAIAIAIVVVGMASACSFQLRETGNLLYLVAMLAMTALASFLDGVSVWEILNHSQNTTLRGIQAVQGVTDDQAKAAEKLVQDCREEIATLTEQSQNMDNDGITANDKLIPGVLAKIESKKADLANFEARADAMRTKVVEAASKVGVSDASRHFFLQIADKHENPALWLISWASVAFLVPELTLALLAWSLKGNRKQGEVRPQPVVIVSHPGLEQGQPAMWQMMPALSAPQSLPQMALSYPSSAAPREVAPPPSYSAPVAPAPVVPAPMPRMQERHEERSEAPVEPVSGSQAQMGLGQWMMATAPAQEAPRPVDSPTPPPAPARAELPRIEAVIATQTVENESETTSVTHENIEEEVILSPESVPEQEFLGAVHGELQRAGDALPQSSMPNHGREGPGNRQSIESDQHGLRKPGQTLSALGMGGTPGLSQTQKASATKAAKNAAAKRSRKDGKRRRGDRLSDIEMASRLN